MRKVYKKGQHIYNITLIEFISPNWKVRCSCGNEKLISSRRLHRTKSCGCKALRKQVTKLQGAINIKYNHYVQKSKERNIAFLLNKEEFSGLILKNCYYCSISPNMTTFYYKEKFLFNGIDRLDSDKPYILNNCVSSCFICNRAKGNLKIEDFKSWIKRLNENYSNF